MKNLTYPFSAKKLPELKEVGGKALSLINMTQADFEVPNGFVLTVEYFEPWIDQVEKMKSWNDFLKSSEEDLKKHCDAVKKDCESLTLSDHQKNNLTKSMKGFDEDNLFAVRSSSPEEDLEGTSFAGGYETVLGVNEKALEKAILHCFISAFDERIVKYKMQHGMKTNKPRIAVIIQKQIDSEVSGVAFSLNPLNNCYDEIVINANFGLGETIVAGQVTPDTFVVDKVKDEIIEKKIAEKDHALWLNASGGTKDKINKHPKKSSLSDEQIKEIADLVTKVEKHYDKPMDIEWAIANDTLYLLQARPITGYLPLFPEMLTKAGEKKNIYLDIIVLTQGFSEPISVLGLDIWARMLDKAKGPTMPRGKNGMVWDIHGRQYLLVSNMLKVGGFMNKVITAYDGPTKMIVENLKKDEYIPDKLPKKLKWYMWGVIKYMIPLLPGPIKGLFKGEQALQNYKDADVKIWKILHEELAKSDKPFSNQVEQGLNGFAILVGAMGGLGSAMFAKWRLGKIFKGHKVDDLLVGLSMDLPGNPTSEMGHLMLKLASYPEFQKTKTAEDFFDKLKKKEYPKEFMTDYQEYIERFGCRGIREIDIATPRTHENPEQIFFQLKQININDNAIKDVKKRSEESYEKLLKIAKKMGKEKKFVKYAKSHHDMMGYREHPKYLYIVVVEILRHRALELGRQFVKQGRLENKDQIFDLTIDQVTKAEKESTMPLLPLVEKNTALYETVEHIKDWPRIIDSRGKIHRAKRESKEGELAGDPIAPGKVKGKAKVLSSPYEKPLKRGEILVCRASEPSWTPVFINAAAVVMEIGGPLQHGGIIAREYGLPCVSSLDNVTKIIKDGDMLEVDGTNGIVKIIK
ncbi:PEP/pyruvate-binding domain-containing protein [Patescibacteria group bacterium]